MPLERLYGRIALLYAVLAFVCGVGWWLHGGGIRAFCGLVLGGWSIYFLITSETERRKRLQLEAAVIDSETCDT